MGARRGFSLLLVLSFCVMAALVLTGVFLAFQWSQVSASMEGRRLRDRLLLSSLVSEGRRWLRVSLADGLLREDERPAPSDFVEVRLLRRERDGGVLEVYDLDYDPARIPAKGWARRGTGRFFPPGPGAFLIRAFRPEDGEPGIMLEVVLGVTGTGSPDIVFVLDSKPRVWQEVWP